MQGGWHKAVPSKSVQRTRNHCSRFPVVFSLCAPDGERDASLSNANIERRREILVRPCSYNVMVLLLQREKCQGRKKWVDPSIQT